MKKGRAKGFRPFLFLLVFYFNCRIDAEKMINESLFFFRGNEHASRFIESNIQSVKRGSGRAQRVIRFNNFCDTRDF